MTNEERKIMAEYLRHDLQAVANQIEADGKLIAELKLRLSDLLEDTQHSEHNCTDVDCPVAMARAALEEWR
jgi:hypothetical protein